MPQFNGYPPAGTLTGAEVLLLAQGLASVNITVAQLFAALNIASLIPTTLSDPYASLSGTLASGFMATVPAGTSRFIVQGTGTLATGTLILPPIEVPFRPLKILFDCNVTALTVTAGAVPVRNAPTSGVQATSVTLLGCQTTQVWYNEQTLAPFA